MLVAQLCLTLCDPMDCKLPGSPVQGILQARILEWIAIAFSRGSSRPRDRARVACIAGGFFTISATRDAVGGDGLVTKSCLTLATPWTGNLPGFSVHGFSRQEYWSRVPLPFPGDLPNPGIQPGSPALQAGSLLTELQGKVVDKFLMSRSLS